MVKGKVAGEFVIGQRFHGPPCSGNGGYTCGMVARYLPGGAVVRLRIPPPLDTPLQAYNTGSGIKVFDHDELIATASEASVEMDIPDPPDFNTAQAASERYRGFKSHFYPACFVCGPARQAGDGLRIFAGPLDGSDVPLGSVAATWVPDKSLTSGNDSVVNQEYIWAVLDCPGAYAFNEPATGTILLGELAVAIHLPVVVGERYVLMGWEIHHEGRKHFTGTALFGAGGECCAAGRATWFEVPVAS